MRAMGRLLVFFLSCWRRDFLCYMLDGYSGDPSAWEWEGRTMQAKSGLEV